MGKFPRKIKGFRIINASDIDETEIFETEEDARDSVEIDEGEMWECVDCGERYEDRDEAYHCCEG
jgi:hypothetical protein